MKLTKTLSALVLALCLVLSCFSFASAEARTDLVVGVAAEPNAFFVCDPNNGTNMDECPVLHNIYDTLIRLKGDGTYEYLLATDHEVSEDGLTYTFTIRDGVKFSDGREMKLEDVVFSFDHSASTKAGQAQLINYSHAEIVDEAARKVAIHLTAPYGGFINAVVNRYGFVYSKEYYEEVGDQGYHEAPITTGPYKFVEHVSGSHVKITYNEYYWGEKPAITDVTYKVLSDVNTQMIGLENEEIDILLNANITPLLQLPEDSPVTYIVRSSAKYANLTFNTSPTQPTADINLRKAIIHAINKEEINFAANENLAEISDLYMPTHFNARPTPGTYRVREWDLEKAKEYLAASNYNGEEVKLVTVAGTKDETVCQIIQGQLLNIGINCTMAAVDAATQTDITSTSGDYAMTLRSGSSSLMDADCLIFAYNVDRMTEPKYDRGWSEEFTTKMRDLTELGRAQVNIEDRRATYLEACEILYDNAMYAPLFYDLNVCAFNKKLQGVVPTALVGVYYIYDWSWAE